VTTRKDRPSLFISTSLQSFQSPTIQTSFSSPDPTYINSARTISSFGIVLLRLVSATVRWTSRQKEGPQCDEYSGAIVHLMRSHRMSMPVLFKHCDNLPLRSLHTCLYRFQYSLPDATGRFSRRVDNDESGRRTDSGTTILKREPQNSRFRGAQTESARRLRCGGHKVTGAR